MKKENNRKVKSRKKIVIISILVIILLLLCMIAVFIFGGNSQDKKEYKEQIANESQTFTEQLLAQMDSFVEAQKNGEQADPNEIENNGQEGVNPTQPTTYQLTAEQQAVVEQEKAKLKDEKKQALLQSLAENYTSVMNQQKDQAFSMLDSLLAQGKAEWSTLQSQGKATPTAKGSLASEYMAKVTSLEKTIDASFATIIAKMESQLKTEGIEPEPIIAQYQADYKKIKESNRDAMFDKAMRAIKGN